MNYMDLATRVADIANEKLREKGYDASIQPSWIYAQWQLEVGRNFDQLAGENNLGNIKDLDGSWKNFNSLEDFAEYDGAYYALYADNGIGNAKTVNQFLDSLFDGGYFTPEDNEGNKYYNSVNSLVNEVEGGENPIDILGSAPVDSNFHSRANHEILSDTPEPPPERDPFTRFIESAQDALLDSGVTSSLRYLWSEVNPTVRGSLTVPGFNTPYSPTDEDIDYVKKLLPNDINAQNFVLTSAKSQDHMFMLAAMKKQDYDRTMRLAQDAQMNGMNVAGILGSLVGGLLDPVNLGTVALSGVGTARAFGKVLSRLGTNAQKLSAFSKIKAAQMAANAATGVAMMGTDRFLASEFGGFDANYLQYMTQAAILGNAFDAMRMVKGAIPRSKTLQRTMVALDKMENNTIAGALDLVPANSLKQDIKRELNSLSSKTKEIDVPDIKAKKTEGVDLPTKKIEVDNHEAFRRKVGMTKLEMEELGLSSPTDKEAKVRHLTVQQREALDAKRTRYVLTERQAIDFANAHGIPITKGTKAFNIPATGQTVVIGDRIKTKQQLKTALLDAHTQSVGIKEVIGEDAYNRLLSDPLNKEVRTTLYDLLEDKHWDASDPLVQKTLKYVRGNIKALRGEKRTNVSDKTLLKWVKWSANEQKYRDTPIRVSKDGTLYMYDTKFDKDNPANLATEEKWVSDQNEVDKKMQASLPSFMPKKLGKFLEASPIFQTIYGVLGSSKLKLVRDMTNRVFLPTRGRQSDLGDTMSVVAERNKRYLQDRVRPFMHDYLDARNEWMSSHQHYNFQEQHRLYFDSEVQKCYNAKYAGNTKGLSPEELQFDPAIEKAADTVFKVRQTCMDIMKEDPYAHGGLKGLKSYMDKDYQVLDNEFTRKVDREALTRLINSMGNDTDKLIEKLDEYAHIAVKKDIVKQQMKLEAERNFKKEHQKWEEANVGKNKEDIPPEPKLKEITDDMVEEEVDKRCKEWALGTVDQSESLACFNHTGTHTGDNIPAFMRRRLPMDTTTRMPLTLRDGSTIDFSFDKFLRDRNTDRIMSSYIDRVCGEVAMYDSLGNWRTDGILDKIEQQLQHGVSQGFISKTTAQREKKAIVEGFSRILSTNMDSDPHTFMDAVSQLLRTKSYADVGGQMFLAQLGEFGSAMAYCGNRVLFDNIPILKGIRRKMLSGEEKNLEDIAKMIQEHTWGNALEARVWDRNASYESRSFRDAMGYSSVIAKRLDKLNSLEKIFSNVTSTLNQLPKLTDAMIKQTRVSGIIDSIKWAHGEKFGFSRQPFSDFFLKAANVKNAEALKKDIIKYIGNDKADVSMLDKWRKENPQTYFEWRNLMDNYSNRGIQQMSVGNTPLLKEKNWFTKLLFQFKDFSFRAINDQTLRVLSSRQCDDALAAMYAMGTNLASYMGLVYLRAYAKYPSDPQARQEYLNRNFTAGRLAWAAFSRGAITGSLPSFGSDIYEILTGTPMMRTTVNNSYNPRNDKGIGSASDIAGRMIKQMPAMSSGLDPMFAGVTSVSHILSDEGLSKEDIAGVMKTMPFNGFWGMTLLNSEINDITEAKSRKELRKQNDKTNTRRSSSGTDSSNPLANLMNVK